MIWPTRVDPAPPVRWWLALAVLAVLGPGCSTAGVPTTASPAPSPTGESFTPTLPVATASATDLRVPKPTIVSKLISFPESRQQEMLAYAQEHYGLDTFELRDPQVIVEHFTATTTFGPVFNTFEANQPDLGESPRTCGAFVLHRP